MLSIITINYNNSSGLQETIDSVLSQDNCNFEYLIIDGGSTDGSLEVLNKHSTAIDYWVSESDSGIYDAMNKGIIRSTGEYIMFLNSGDLLADNTVIEKCMLELGSNTDVDILYGDMIPLNHSDSHYTLHSYPDELQLKFFKRDTINHQASLIKKDLFREFGCYPIKYRLASDYWLFLQSYLHHKKFYHIKYGLVKYDFSGLSSLDSYKSYREEQNIIWNLLVPKEMKKIICENEKLEQQVLNLNRILSYRILVLALKVNSYFQKLKSFLR